MRERLVISILAAVLIIDEAKAQSVPAETPTTEPAVADEEAPIAWEFSLSAYTYIVPDERDYVQPTFTADYDWLHLEARYNYEDLDTGSAWIGCNFAGGTKLEFEFTPMLGGVFGDTNGIAPGCEASLTWWKVNWYTEVEYVFDVGDSSDSFFYAWSELSLAPVDWFRFGVVIQRTKVLDTDFEVQRGFLAGITLGQFEFTAYVFNPDEDPIVVLGAGIRF